MRLILDNPEHRRRVYDCDTHIYKVMPNGTDHKFTLEEIYNNAEHINNVLGFIYFRKVSVKDEYIHMEMTKLKPCEYSHYVLNDILDMLKIYLDINISIFPLCNTDVQNDNLMLWQDTPVPIDWDDALQGHKHTAFYVVAELYKECVKIQQKWDLDYYVFIRDYIKGTRLEISDEQWNWITHNTQGKTGFHFNYEPIKLWAFGVDKSLKM
mgnify:FL=1